MEVLYQDDLTKILNIIKNRGNNDLKDKNNNINKDNENIIIYQKEEKNNIGDNDDIIINTKKILINKDTNLISRLNINRRQKSNNSNKNINRNKNKNKNNSSKKSNNSNKTNTYESVLRKLRMVRDIDDRKFNRNTVKTDVLNKLYTMNSSRINKILHNGIETFNDYNDVVSDMTININLSEKENILDYNMEKFISIIEKTVSKDNRRKTVLFDIVISKGTNKNTNKEFRHVLVVSLKYNIVKMIHLIPYLQDFFNLKDEEKVFILNSITGLMPIINGIVIDANPKKYNGIIYLNPYNVLNYLDKKGNKLKKCFDKQTCVEWSILISILLLRKNICSLYYEKDDLISLYEDMIKYKSRIILQFWNIIDDNLKKSEKIENKNSKNNIQTTVKPEYNLVNVTLVENTDDESESDEEENNEDIINNDENNDSDNAYIELDGNIKEINNTNNTNKNKNKKNKNKKVIVNSSVNTMNMNIEKLSSLIN